MHSVSGTGSGSANVGKACVRACTYRDSVTALLVRPAESHVEISVLEMSVVAVLIEARSFSEDPITFTAATMK